MTLLKSILAKQAGVLGNLEENLPAGVPRVSQLMANIAVTFPMNPDLPELPIVPGNGFLAPKSSASLIKGDEELGSEESRLDVVRVEGDLSSSLKDQILS